MSAIKLTTMAIVVAAFVAICKGKMAFKEQCLYWHNYFRTLHQVPPVTWSMDLQKEAEEWVKYLAENNKFQHSRHNPGNLYLQEQIPKEYCSDAIWWFHWEEKKYNYSNPRYSRSSGHFSQVVWRNSKEIGAAWALRKDGKLVVSIKYKPGGNYVGYFANNVFRPTARVLSDLDWKVQPPKFTLCPEDAVETPSSAAPVPAKVASCFQVQLLNTFLVIMGLIL
ncbi:Golgi-associated plant pathogenesis-related protein 1-like isoform X3 [Acropora palmata]|uniref:Golgi-associated plant pathogenesis-related protein 1-like isoform X3 n=2 Tax=Acropora palmata TaxID=6131 RepID=UPI003DA07B00